jgi:hypothetical protein
VTTKPDVFLMRSPVASPVRRTLQVKRDLRMLRLRGAFDPKRFYKSADATKFPKYFHMGTVVEGPTDFYSGVFAPLVPSCPARRRATQHTWVEQQRLVLSGVACRGKLTRLGLPGPSCRALRLVLQAVCAVLFEVLFANCQSLQ